jgi:6-methylsalicylate decarboxylase
MKSRPHDEPDAFGSQGTNDVHSTAACYSRRTFIGGVAGASAGAAFTHRHARAQGTAVAEEGVSHRHSPSPRLTRLREIEYARDTLKMDGICMMTDYQGKFLGDPAFAPVMEELNRRKAVVYTHPFRNECCRNLVPDVFEPLVELGADTTRTIASLLFSGSAARFPDIKWIFSHAGGTAPFLMQRFTYYFAARKDLQQRLPEGPAYYLSRFYYDTANAMTIHPLASLTKVVAPMQIVFGTDFPFLTAKNTAAGLRAVGLFSATDLQAIERGNAAGLMPRYRT